MSADSFEHGSFIKKPSRASPGSNTPGSCFFRAVVFFLIGADERSLKKITKRRFRCQGKKKDVETS
jgi:hypothetical protein